MCIILVDNQVSVLELVLHAGGRGGGISLLIDRTFPYLKTYFESVLIHEAYVS